MYEIYAKLRDSRGLSDYRIAEETGISRAMLSSWKLGKYTPKIDKLQKIADYFGVSLEYLRTGEMNEGYYWDAKTAKLSQKQLIKAKKQRNLAENRHLVVSITPLFTPKIFRYGTNSCADSTKKRAETKKESAQFIIRA